MASLSVSDAASMAGVSIESMVDKINRGELKQTDRGVAISELIRVYPKLKPLASVKIRNVKKTPATVEPRVFQKPKPMVSGGHVKAVSKPVPSTSVKNITNQDTSASTLAQTQTQAGTVELLVRELEWNKELLEQTNQLMEKQLADQRALIKDQARRLDEKDRFWARQIEIAQSLLPAPQSVVAPRKKIFGIF